jgi:sulfur carrier protein ThiS
VRFDGTGVARIQTMNIDVALFAYLSQYQPDGEGGRHPRRFEYPDGSLISDVIADLDLPDGPRVIFVNGRHAPESQELHTDDRLGIFPPVAGG